MGNEVNVNYMRTREHSRYSMSSSKLRDKKSTALAEMLEIYMLCQDEELYTELKKKSLGSGGRKADVSTESR